MTHSYQAFLEAAIAERGSDHPVFRYNDKVSGRALAASLGVRVPELLQGPGPLKSMSAPERAAVVKPVNGCSTIGVFPLVPQGDVYRNLFNGELMSWDQVVEAALAAKHTLSNQRLQKRNHKDAVRPPWILEELILRPGTQEPTLSYDYKAFCFGGRTEAVRQVDRTGGVIRTRWYDREWNPIGDILPHRKWTPDPQLPVARRPRELVEMAETVARAVDSPFLRVDMLEGERGPVFCELTPHPTGGSVRFIPEWDERLGRAWASAAGTG